MSENREAAIFQFLPENIRAMLAQHYPDDSEINKDLPFDIKMKNIEDQTLETTVNSYRIFMNMKLQSAKEASSKQIAINNLAEFKTAIFNIHLDRFSMALSLRRHPDQNPRPAVKGALALQAGQYYNHLARMASNREDKIYFSFKAIRACSEGVNFAKADTPEHNQAKESLQSVTDYLTEAKKYHLFPRINFQRFFSYTLNHQDLQTLDF